MKIMEDKSLCIPPVRPSGNCGLSRKGEVSRETNYFIDYSNFSAVSLYGWKYLNLNKIDENSEAMLE